MQQGIAAHVIPQCVAASTVGWAPTRYGWGGVGWFLDLVSSTWQKPNLVTPAVCTALQYPASNPRSIPALLQACAPLLSPVPHARLHLESISVFNAAQQQQPTITPAAFAEAALGLKLDTHETLLGLHMVAGATIPGLQAGIRLAWAPTSRFLPGDEAAASAAVGAFSRLSFTTGSQSSTQGSAGAAFVSAVGLFMDLKQAYKHFVEAYLEPIAAASSLSRSSRGSITISGNLGGLHWESKGSPVTLVHLLTLVRKQHCRNAALRQRML